MKKYLFLLISAIVCLSFASCSGSKAKADAVAQKIENNEDLSQEDYTFMYKYVIDACDNAIKAVNDLGEDSTKEDLEKMEEKIEADYPHMEVFNKELSRVHESDLNDTNKKLSKERAKKLMEFLGTIMSK